MIIIGKPCPPFSAPAVVNLEIKTLTEQNLKGHYTLLFFYAVDFSAVCPTEIYSLQKYLEEFKKRNVEIICISVDSIYTHLAWLKTPKSNGGIEGTTFTLLSDLAQTISKSFGVFDESQGLSYRGTFLLDENLIIRYGAVNNMAFGRSTQEILRTIDAIIYTRTNKMACPANWKAGQAGIKHNGIQ